MSTVELGAAVHAADPAGREHRHAGRCGQRDRRRHGRRPELPSPARSPPGRSRSAALRAAPSIRGVLGLVEPDARHTVEHGGDGGNRSPGADRGEATIERFGVGGDGQAEVREDRRFQRHDGAPFRDARRRPRRRARAGASPQCGAAMCLTHRALGQSWRTNLVTHLDVVRVGEQVEHLAAVVAVALAREQTGVAGHVRPDRSSPAPAPAGVRRRPRGDAGAAEPDRAGSAIATSMRVPGAGRHAPTSPIARPGRPAVEVGDRQSRTAARDVSTVITWPTRVAQRPRTGRPRRTRRAPASPRPARSGPPDSVDQQLRSGRAALEERGGRHPESWPATRSSRNASAPDADTVAAAHDLALAAIPAGRRLPGGSRHPERHLHVRGRRSPSRRRAAPGVR